MQNWMIAWKPAAPARTHLLMAALMWSVVGGALMFFGVRWTLASHVVYAALLVAVAVIIGLLKSRLALDRTARRVIDRIRQRGDGRCLGGFLSPRTWLFVLLMMGLGRLLRAGLLPMTVVGFIYIAVGAALLLSSRSFWLAWQQHSKATIP